MEEKYNVKPTKEDLEKCKLLVLCKGELFFQTEDGDTLLILYPVAEVVAEILSELYNIEWITA